METEENEIRSTAAVEDQDIEEIQLWLETQPHLPQNISGDLIKSFLHSNYLNIDKTKRTIEIYYQIKSNSPDFFNNRDLDSPEMLQVCDVVDMCIMPKKSAKGYVVLFARLNDCDPTRFVLEDAIKLLFTMIDSVLLTDPTPKGFVFVFDNEGTNYKHLFKVTISILKRYITYLQEGIPVRMKQIHVINCNFIVTQVMNLIKPFLNGSHEIILHTPDKIEEMYTAVPQEVLPQEYGGKSANLAELKADSYSQIRKFTSWYQKDESLRIDETKRKKSNEYGGISGFFRRISLTS